MSKTDFGKIKEYANFVAQDPFRNGLHYPAILRILGLVKDKNILDVGCGDGLFTRMLAEKGASLVGYDMAPEMIEKARKFNQLHDASVLFKVATPETFKSNVKFDAAVSVMVLSYATSPSNLKEFFISTYYALKPGGTFSSVIFSPTFKRFSEVLGARRFEKLEDNNVEVYFLNPKTKQAVFTSVLHQFTRSEYESSAREAGFATWDWLSLYPAEVSQGELGDDFWAGVVSSQPYSVLVAKK